MASTIKQNLYGSDRILDGKQSIKNEYIRKLGLDYGTKLRWYVEGDTEYYGLYAKLNWLTTIDFVNLRGNVVAKGGKGISFRDNLKSDLRSHIFSFISLDGDNSEYTRTVSKAAKDDDICGMFFISNPDFEFANFTIDELVSIVWELAIELGVNPNEKESLIRTAANSKSSKEFEKSVQKAFPSLNQFSKGKGWGEKLMRYAWENPEVSIDESTKHIRPIIETIQLAIKAATLDVYHVTRIMFRVDPNTGKPISRGN